MARAFLGALALLAATACGTAGVLHVQAVRGADFVVPRDSPVGAASAGAVGEVAFAGRFAMPGTFHYGYIGQTSGSVELSFVPDRAFAKRLPRWSEAGAPDVLVFDNESAFVDAAIPPSVRDAIARRELASVSGRATVVVERYHASVECNWPWYSVTFVQLDQPTDAIASREPLPLSDGC